jgi:RNA polymerase sigma factor (sigma-70 family)
MKVTYEFINGESSEAEVEEKLGTRLRLLDNVIKNNDRCETRRHVSIQKLEEIGFLLPDERTNPEKVVIQKIEKEQLKKAVQQLNKNQQKLIYLHFYLAIPLTRIAEREGVTRESISRRLRVILRRLRESLHSQNYSDAMTT